MGLRVTARYRRVPRRFPARFATGFDGFGAPDASEVLAFRKAQHDRRRVLVASLSSRRVRQPRAVLGWLFARRLHGLNSAGIHRSTAGNVVGSIGRSARAFCRASGRTIVSDRLVDYRRVSVRGRVGTADATRRHSRLSHSSYARRGPGTESHRD